MIRHISPTLTIGQAHARLPIRFRRQLTQAYRLAAVSYPNRPLALIQFTVLAEYLRG
jgi:hypothetical protein